MKLKHTSIYALCLVLASCAGTGTAVQKYEPVEEGVQRAYFEAQNHLVKGDLDLAYNKLQTCAQAEPEIASFHFELGKIDYELGRYDDAYANLYRAATIDPENDWYSYYKGLSLIAIEGYDEAWGDLAYWISKRPSDIGSLIACSQLFLEVDQPVHAIKLLFYYENEIAKNLDVRMMELSLMVGYVLSDIEGLNEFVDDAIEDFPDVPEFHYEKAMLSFFKEDYPTAIAQFRQVQADFPEFEKTTMSLGECLWANGEFKEALKYFGTAFKSYEIDAGAKLTLLLEIQKAEFEGLVSIEEIEPLVQSAVSRHPDDADLMFYAAMFFADAGQLEKAESTILSVLEMAPNKLGAHLNLIDLYYQKKQRNKALETAESAIEIFPLEPRFFLYAADGYKNKKEYETAVKRLKTGLAVIMDAPELEAVFYSELGYCYRELGDKKNSYDSFEKSLKKVEDPLVMNNHAFFLAKDGVLLEQAYKWSVLSNELVPNDPHFLDTLALVLYLRGEYEDALDAIQKAQNLILPKTDEVYQRRENKILKALGR